MSSPAQPSPGQDAGLRGDWHVWGEKERRRAHADGMGGHHQPMADVRGADVLAGEEDPGQRSSSR
ncbi:hypothetical protein [Salinispora mooreana]|uniref:hypothetical protein n=1 Tax=Salinispora mooreana TaxID=999545 RepID=UPI0013A53FD1|nr:hypothetical protein [Salinispora mooreana]